MQRRATSKRRAAEADKEIDMDDKEATPVEDLEEILPPTEPSRPVPQEEQIEKPTQTGDADFLEILRAMNKNMESLKENFNEKLNKNNESLTKNMESMNRKMDDSQKNIELLKEEL